MAHIHQTELTLSAECEPLTTIAGCVNICSGHFFQVERDLIGDTIDPLSIVRTYDSGSNSESFLGYGFGSGFPLWASTIQKSTRHHYAMISEREGFLLPYRGKDLTLTIELKGKTFFPIQDFRGNICALQRADGSLAQWVRYSAFGEKAIMGDLQGMFNPWRFANRREVADLSLFTYRLYNPHLMHWQTADPLGFEDGLNLYAYVHNNPFCYKDPDGQTAIPFLIPILEFTFGAALSPLIIPTLGVIATATIIYSANQLLTHLNSKIDESENTDDSKKEKNPRFNGKDLGKDPTKCPGTGFEWKGKGSPESGKGAWHNANTNESLYPDFNHPSPGTPHWDYNGPDFPNGIRLNLDGTYELKL